MVASLLSNPVGQRQHGKRGSRNGAKALRKKSAASLEQKQETIRTLRVIKAALFRPSRDFVFLD
jgi:hypothetical protein